jgi:hypothetical protein
MERQGDLEFASYPDDVNFWSAGNVTVVGEQAELDVATSANVSAVYSTPMEGGAFSVRLVQPPNVVPDDSSYSTITLTDLSGTSIYLTWQSGAWVSSGDVPTLTSVALNPFTIIGSIIYDPSLHQYQRIRVQDGVGYFETSADGVTWFNTLGNSDDALPDNNFGIASAGIFAQCGAGAPDPGTAIYSNIDLLFELADTTRITTLADPAWSYGTGANIVGGQLILDCDPGFQGYAQTLAKYGLTGATLSVQLVTVPTNPASVAQFGVIDINGNNYLISYSDGTLTLSGSLLVDTTTITYNPTQHQYLRFRENSGTIYFETSPDGNTWHNTLGSSYTTNDSADFSAVNVLLNSQNAPDTDTAIYANLNILPTPPPPGGNSLAAPCTLQQLRVWLQNIDILNPGRETLIDVAHGDTNIYLGEHTGTITTPYGTLPTPCTLQQLRTWLQNIDTRTPGTETTCNIT